MTPLFLLALTASPAQALELSSLRSDTTYELFRDPYDFYGQPGVLGTIEERGVLTLLSHSNGMGRFMGGYYGSLGPGVLGVAMDYGQSAGTTTVTNTEAWDEDTGITTTGDTFAHVNAWDVALSYGIPMGDTLTAGAGLFITHIGQRYSVDPTSLALGGSIGTITYPDVAETDDYTSYGNSTSLDQTITAVVGGAITSDSSLISANAYVSQATKKTSIDAGYTSGDYKGSAAGYYPGTGLDGNRSGLSFGVLLDTAFALSDVSTLRVEAGAGLGSGKMAEDVFLSKTITPIDEEDVVEETTKTTLKDASYKGNTLHLLTVIELDYDELDVRPGLSIDRVGYSDQYTPESTYDNSELDDTTVSTGAVETSKSSALAIGLPLAVEIPLSKAGAWTLRMAGQYTWVRGAFEGVSTLDVEEVDTDTVAKIVAKQSLSTVNGAIGLRFWPVDAFRLDAGAMTSSSLSTSAGSSSYTEAGGDPTNIASLYLSGTFLLK